MLNEKIFWHGTVSMPSGAETAPLPEKVDVAILGGGITGLNAARELAQFHVKVAVLEAESTGWGASSRNGGIVLTGLKLGMQTVMKKYGRELAHRLFQFSLHSIRTVENLVHEENIECGFVRAGHLLAARKPKHYDGLVAEAEFMAQEFNHPLRLVPRSEQRNEIGSDAYDGALVEEATRG